MENTPNIPEQEAIKNTWEGLEQPIVEETTDQGGESEEVQEKTKSEQLLEMVAQTDDQYGALKEMYGGEVPDDLKNALANLREVLNRRAAEERGKENAEAAPDVEALIPEDKRESFREWMNGWGSMYGNVMIDIITSHSKGESMDSIKSRIMGNYPDRPEDFADALLNQAKEFIGSEEPTAEA